MSRPARRRAGGRRLAAEGAEETPVLWAIGELRDAAAVWLALKDRLSGGPLVPVLLSGLGRQPERPWDVGELEPCHPGAVGELDAAVLSTRRPRLQAKSDRGPFWLTRTRLLR